MKNRLIHISFSKIDFQCPYCGKEYLDEDDKFLNRCNTNKSGIARMKCTCGERFGMTYNIKSNAVAFKL